MRFDRVWLFGLLVTLSIAAGCGPVRPTTDDVMMVTTPDADMGAPDHACVGVMSLNCDGVCIDPMTDFSNCHACGNTCPSGNVCVGGVCSTSCPTGERACGTVCVTVSNDRENCGTCGHRCSMGQVCSDGVCATNCGSSLMTCIRGGSTDGGVTDGGLDASVDDASDGAVDVAPIDAAIIRYCANFQQDRANCGGCGITCSAGEICMAGTCMQSCPATQSTCGTVCVDLTNDPANCGTCGMACVNQVCSSGVCTDACGTGQMFCDGRCVNTQTDRTHCGDCTTTCADGLSCVSGVCAVVCPPDQMQCGSICVFGQTDPTNCGSCGNTCPQGETCNAGTCAPTCAIGTVACGHSCVDITTDGANCGSCGAPCLTGQFCNGGACTAACMSNQINCGLCVNPVVDPANCGGCGVTCGPGYACVASLCQPLVGTDASGCSPPSLMCGTSCTNIRSDNLNCGGCGRACSSDRTCIAGSCVAPCAAGQVRCAGVCTTVAFDRNNCGSCGNSCMQPLSCVNSACVDNPTFEVSTLDSTGCTVVEDSPLSGFRQGGIAISPNTAFHVGSNATVRMSASDLTGQAALTQTANGIANDIRTGTVYVLLDAANRQPHGQFLSGTVVLTQLATLDDNGTLTATRIPLSMPIIVAQNTGIFSGYGRILLHSGDSDTPRWYDIRLPSGTVTPLQLAATPGHESCSNWAYWGVGEFFNGDYYAVYAAPINFSTGPFQVSRIIRHRVRDGLETNVATFANLSDLCELGFVPSRNRWYFHHSGNSDLSNHNFSQTMGYCNGTFSTP